MNTKNGNPFECECGNSVNRSNFCSNCGAKIVNPEVYTEYIIDYSNNGRKSFFNKTDAFTIFNEEKDTYCWSCFHSSTREFLSGRLLDSETFERRKIEY
jgi:hypothetical protein